MELLADPSTRLTSLRHAQEAMAGPDVGKALAVYCESYPWLVAKAPCEWSLVAKLVGDGAAVTPPAAWPPDLLARPSGAALAFAVAQLAGSELVLPPGLVRLAAVPLRHRRDIAVAWRLRPGCSGLDDPHLRERFALWLAASPEAIGDCLLAAAQRGDSDLAGCLGPLWLARGLFHAGAPQQIESASRWPCLEQHCRAAVCTAVGLFADDSEALLRLLTAAFSLRAFATVLALAELLLLRPELAEEERCHTLALKLGALAELDRWGEAAEEYRCRWLPAGRPFPHPEWLLYAFQLRGEADLERRLLEAAEIGDDTPQWVRLSRDLLHHGRCSGAALEAWEALYLAEPRDLRVLVGVSSALLLASPLLRLDRVARLGILARWGALTRHAPLRELAGAFVVLLQETEEERIEQFEVLLGNTWKTPASAQARRAARAYVAALRRRKRWVRLRELDSSDPDLFDLACPFAERELARLLARQSDAPRDAAGLRRWCAGWERLLGLPLSGSELAEVVELFVNLRHGLESQAPTLAADELLGDVELQVLWRAKVQAELLLARSRDGQRTPAWAQRLLHARLEATFRLLQELQPLGEADDHA
jgi:hypothetical protein